MISKSKLVGYLDNKIKDFTNEVKELDLEKDIENIWVARSEMWFAVKLISLIEKGEFDKEEAE